MAITTISDIVTIQGYSDYVATKTLELNKMIQAGIILASPAFDAIANQGGKLNTMPFWNPASGDSEEMQENVEVSASAFTAGYDQSRTQFRTKMWGRTDLSVAMANSDPFTALGNYTADYWSTELQKVAMYSLKGAFASGSDLYASNVKDISALTGSNAYISADAIVDTLNLLGDSANKDNLAIVMHSAVHSYLLKQDLIDTVIPSAGASQLSFYLNHPVLVDDMFTATNGVYSTYLCGQGSIALGNGTPLFPSDEAFREPAKHNEYLVTRRQFIVHPLGIRWNEASVAGKTPTFAELGTAANWSKVYDTKNIRIVKLAHKIG